MLMIVMSLAISIVSLPSFTHNLQQVSLSSQTSQRKQAQQEKKDPKYPTVVNVPFEIGVQPILLPPGENAWSVQIVTRGGFTGSGKGDITLSSDGLLTWKGQDGSCSNKLSTEAVQSLAKLVFDADPSGFSNFRSTTAVCADCYVTAMVVQRRTTSETIRLLSASWEDVSQDKVPADVMNIYNSLMALKGCKPQ